MSLSKTFIVITNQPLTKHNFIRLGVGSTYKDWKIKYWSILPIINKKIYQDYTKEGSRYLKNKDFKEILSYSHLVNEIKKLPNNFFYSNSAGNNFLAIFIDRTFFFLGGKKISFDYGSEIDINFYTLENIKNYFQKYNLLRSIIKVNFMIIDKIVKFFLLKLVSTPIFLRLVFNNNMYQKIKKKIKKDSIIKVDSPELELFLKTKKRKKKSINNILFIDDVVEGSFDYKLGHTQAKDRKSSEYWGPTKDFLDHVKSHLPKNKILIAAHHRRNKKDIPITGFKFFFDKTSELIQNSRIVLCHNSLACQIAVLFKKPIIFVTSYYYQKNHYNSHKLTIELSKALGSDLIYIGKNFKKTPSIIKKIKTAKVNVAKYEEYRKRYIQFNDLKIHGRWQNILRNLDNRSFNF